jgi:hypothetical protein
MTSAPSGPQPVRCLSDYRVDEGVDEERAEDCAPNQCRWGAENLTVVEKQEVVETVVDDTVCGGA